MPLLQGLYLEGSTDLREGEIVMAGVTTDQLSGANASTTVIFPFGRAAILASGAIGSHEKNLLTLPTTAGQTIRGISIATDIIERIQGVSVDANGNPGYPVQGSPIVQVMSIATKGMIAVKTTETVAKGDVVTALITVGATQGQFGKTASASQIACPTTWEWYTSAASGAIGVIYLK